MAVLSRDEFFTRLHSRLAEDTSDDGISLLEDFTDTYNDLENRANGNGEDWERRYHELDEAWKKRYRHRFFTGSDRTVPGESGEETNEAETISVEDLFEKEEK